jgi:uncharacterized protein (DUF4415 family)
MITHVGVEEQEDAAVEPTEKLPMKDEYDFSNSKRGAVIPQPAHQTEVRLRLDNEVLGWLRERVNEAGGGDYQSMINTILQTYIEIQEDAALIRAIKEGEGSGEVSRAEVFAVLQGRK